MKYKQDIGIADILSHYLIEQYSALGWKADLVIPVPLSKLKYIERGYNQTRLLSFPIGLALGITHDHKSLQKIKETKPQVGLNLEERSKNVDGVFWADPNSVSGKVILLVDDVMTTGATVNSCSGALVCAGAASVYILTVARATLKNHTNIL